MAYDNAIVSQFLGLFAKPIGQTFASSGSGVMVAHDNSPFASAYPWTNNVGFGTKFANPATLPGGTRTSGVVFTPNGDTVFLAGAGSPFVFAYPWNRITGWGTKYANPATIANGVCLGIAVRSLAASTFHHVAAADSDAGAAIFTNAWRFSKTGAGWGTKFANPATPPTGPGASVEFHPDGLSVAFAHTTSPFVTAYPWSDSGFGVKYANPATLPENQATGVDFSSLGAALGLAHAGAINNLGAWHFASATGFGTKYADPSYPAGWFPMTTIGINFRKDAVSLGHLFSATNTNAFTAWQWSEAGGFGTRYATNAALAVTGAGSGSVWNDAGSTFFGALIVTPRIKALRWLVTSGFGTAYSNPATLPANAGNDAAVAI